MLIEKLLEFVSGLWSFLLGWLNIPDMPAEIISVLDKVKQAMIDGLNIFGFFIDITVFRVCCTLFVALFVVHNLWKFIRWILKKIPFVNMS